MKTNFMRWIITLTLTFPLLSSANTLNFDETNPITISVAVSDAERNSQGYQIEYIDSKSGFHNVFPVDIAVKTFNTAEETEAVFEITAHVLTPTPGKLTKQVYASKIKSQRLKGKLKKGANTTTFRMIPAIQLAAEEFIDTRPKGTKGTGIALGIRIYIKDKEVASIRKDYSAHLE